MPFSSVLFDGARSALPPIKPGSFFAISFKMTWFVSLVASFLSLKSGNSILLKSGLRSEFNKFLPSMLNASTFLFHIASSRSPFSTAPLNLKSTSSSIANFFSGSKPAAAFAFLMISSPSGAPWLWWLPSSSIAPRAMCVFAMMRYGDSFSLACSRANSIWLKSCPSMRATSQPCASNLALTSSLNAIAVSPSIVMLFES